MAQPDPAELAKFKAARTYNSAADHFDDPPLAFWSLYGQRTVAQLQLHPGANVLDVGCGTGASAIPAAEAVGPGGTVIGVDLAEKLLQHARAKALAQQLTNADFRVGDMTALGFPDEHFDAIISVFSVFFVPDMVAQVRELWRMVKPQGKLAITTWGPEMFMPMNDVWRAAVRAERPDLYVATNPWDRITTPDQLRQLLASGGITDAAITTEAGQQTFQSPADWWTVVLGSGLRGTLDQMSPETAARVREQNVTWAHEHHVMAIQTNVIYAIATKP
jgi:2-polyprenyl-3-methyl-5-hydroxy-6-metoxy-1,4-benzoquinol methylase